MTSVQRTALHWPRPAARPPGPGRPAAAAWPLTQITSYNLAQSVADGSYTAARSTYTDLLSDNVVNE